MLNINTLYSYFTPVEGSQCQYVNFSLLPMSKCRNFKIPGSKFQIQCQNVKFSKYQCQYVKIQSTRALLYNSCFGAELFHVYFWLFQQSPSNVKLLHVIRIGNTHYHANQTLKKTDVLLQSQYVQLVSIGLKTENTQIYSTFFLHFWLYYSNSSFSQETAESHLKCSKIYGML